MKGCFQDEQNAITYVYSNVMPSTSGVRLSQLSDCSICLFVWFLSVHQHRKAISAKIDECILAIDVVRVKLEFEVCNRCVSVHVLFGKISTYPSTIEITPKPMLLLHVSCANLDLDCCSMESTLSIHDWNGILHELYSYFSVPAYHVKFVFFRFG